MTKSKPLSPRRKAILAAKDRLALRRGARSSFLEFVRFVFWKPWPFLVGQHTRAICDAIDKAIDDYLAGKSTNLDIVVPFRHGKSDLVSRALPPYFLGRCQAAGLDPDVIMSGYGADLVEQFSRDAKTIIKSTKYHELFPDVAIPRGDNSIQSWKIAGGTGRVTATGLGGSLVGKGGDLIIVDDYCKSRAEARSKKYRKTTWSAFQDVLSRRAPVSIVIICATPWHVDDIRGRIKKEREKNKDFPKFRILKFPAKDPESGAFLFPERFPDSWYREQYAAQGSLSAALLDCSPVVEGGNRFLVDRIQYHDLKEIPKGKYIRAWDLASSAKERDSDDPDYTVGILGTVVLTTVERDGFQIIKHDLWIVDMVFVRAEATERNKLILDTTKKDGQAVQVVVEAFGAYKDTYVELKRTLKGVRSVSKANLPGDKSAKLAPVEPVMEAGGVHLVRAPWNDLFVQTFREFPDGDHDDPPDAAAIVFDFFTREKDGIALPGRGKRIAAQDPDAIFAR